MVGWGHLEAEDCTGRTLAFIARSQGEKILPFMLWWPRSVASLRCGMSFRVLQRGHTGRELEVETLLGLSPSQQLLRKSVDLTSNTAGLNHDASSRRDEARCTAVKHLSGAEVTNCNVVVTASAGAEQRRSHARSLPIMR